jgi:8-amino-7-oxononanoate synthase
MDIFDRCFAWDEDLKAEAAGLHPYFHEISSGQDPEVICEGKRMIMVGSNNYLGLTSHPKLKRAAKEATDKYGVGCVGSRFLNGTLDIHVELERRLAEFMDREAALSFTTGMQTNLGVISALVGKNDLILTDKYDHASIIDGCRLSFAEMKRFRHNDMEQLERLLSTKEPDQGCLIVIDGVFSMEGDLANVPDIVRLARKYDARVMLDDAHGVGVMGKNGRGTAEHFGLNGEVDIIMASFSKSFASIGGFVVTSDRVVQYLKHRARALIFSASLPPSIVASVLAALDIIENEPERRHMLMKVAHKMYTGLKSLGFEVGNGRTPIIPVYVGDNMLAFMLWRKLFDAGVFATPVVSPAVPPGRALIRVSCMATHTDEHVEMVVNAFADAAAEVGLIPSEMDRATAN